MRIEACGDRIIHVVASPTGEIPAPKVPVVPQPCRADNVVVKIGKKDVTLSTAGVTVSVNAATGAVSFLSKDGKKCWLNQRTAASPSTCPRSPR